MSNHQAFYTDTTFWGAVGGATLKALTIMFNGVDNASWYEQMIHLTFQAMWSAAIGATIGFFINKALRRIFNHKNENQKSNENEKI